MKKSKTILSREKQKNKNAYRKRYQKIPIF